MDLPPRLRSLPITALPGGLRLAEARGLRARTLGLARLDGLPPRTALLIPRCGSVHTFGMRFALDLVFLGEGGEVIRVVEGVGRGRVVLCRKARAVVELPAGEGSSLVRAFGGRG